MNCFKWHGKAKDDLFSFCTVTRTQIVVSTSFETLKPGADQNQRAAAFLKVIWIHCYSKTDNGNIYIDEKRRNSILLRISSSVLLKIIASMYFQTLKSFVGFPDAILIMNPYFSTDKIQCLCVG